jgi:hypothetical protein
MTLPEHLFVSSSDGGLYDTRVEGWNKLPPLRPNYERHYREIGTVAELKASLRAGAYAWPGGYEILYLTTYGDCLCDACVRKEFRQIAEAIRTNDLRSGWAIGAALTTAEVESFLACDHCGRVIFEDEESE